MVFLKLLFYLKPVLKFVNLERQQGTSWLLLLKKIYANAHLLKANVDWLHFGFATMALGKELVAESIGAHMAVSLRGFDIAIYPIKHPGCYDLVWKKVDKVHTISDDLLALAYKNGLSKKVSGQKITPAIDCTQFNGTRLKEERQENQLSIITVARLHWKKGLIYTLRALALLKEKGVDFHYTIIGEGEQYEELMYTIHLLGLTNQVFLVGKQSPDEVKIVLASSAIYIQYSISEGFCNAVLEAQAMGLLCVVSDAEGLSENVLHNQTGWVVEKRNPEKLANQLVAVINLSDDMKHEIINNAKDRVRLAFNIQKQQEEFVEFYKC
jgi:colanic acid/amylovoran biosynthesis glycosyltransferase